MDVVLVEGARVEGALAVSVLFKDVPSESMLFEDLLFPDLPKARAERELPSSDWDPLLTVHVASADIRALG